jgi:hypothetical protein
MKTLAALLLAQTLSIYVSPEHPYSIAYDRDVWTSDGSDEEGVDLVLQHRSGKADAVILVHEGTATLDALRENALKNGRETTPDLKVVSEARVKKDGAELLTMHFTGTSSEGPVAYRGVYWAGPDKYVQLIATTTRETDKDVQVLLDGLSIRVPKTEKRAFTLDYAPTKWRVTDDGSTSGNMYFNHSAGDASAIVNAVRIDAAPATLRAWVLEQAKALAPDVKIVSEQPKSVNGAQVMMMQLEGSTSEGVPIVMLGYFFRGGGAYVQAVTVTARARFAQRKADMTELLDGLQIHVGRE